MIIFDAHEDLAWNVLTFQRDYRRSVTETRALEAGGQAPTHNGNTLLGRPEWIQGKVALTFATLFAAPERRSKGEWDTQSYSDGEQAHAKYREQLDLYTELSKEQRDDFRLIVGQSGLEQHVREWEIYERSMETGELSDEHERRVAAPPLGMVLLMEGSDGVQKPEDLEEWHRLGLRVLGPAWTGTRHAGGTGEPGSFSAEGLHLVEVMGTLGMALDMSHLAEAAAWEALERYDGPMLASHSNPLGMMPGSDIADRHLGDDIIKGIAERDGVIGIVPFNRFLRVDWRNGDPKEAVGVEDVVAHIDYVCQLLGSANHVGIGSDFDGGFGLESVPAELDSVADLGLIGQQLSEKGYSDTDLGAVLAGNWIRILDRTL